jgi:hypothetical protein
VISGPAADLDDHELCRAHRGDADETDEAAANDARKT